SPVPRSHPHLLSFPTRRSSDLCVLTFASADVPTMPAATRTTTPRTSNRSLSTRVNPPNLRPSVERIKAGPEATHGPVVRRRGLRSEEHTSELQSRFDLVCRLLL